MKIPFARINIFLTVSFLLCRIEAVKAERYSLAIDYRISRASLFFLFIEGTAGGYDSGYAMT